MPKLSTYFQRALLADNQQRQEWIDEQEDQRELEEVAMEEALLIRNLENAGFCLGKFATVEMGLDKGDGQEATDGSDCHEHCKQAPAGAPDELVVDVLIGLDADEQGEHQEGDDACKDAFLDRLGHDVVGNGFRYGRHVTPSPLQDDRGCRSA